MPETNLPPAIPRKQSKSSIKVDLDPKRVGGKPNQADQIDQIWSRPNWSSSLERIFVDILVEKKVYLDFENRSFDEEAWDEICSEFRKGTSLQFDKQELKIQYSFLRKRFRIAKKLHDHGGFGWDPYRKMVDIDDLVWEEYIEKMGLSYLRPAIHDFRPSKADGRFAVAFGGGNWGRTNIRTRAPMVAPSPSVQGKDSPCSGLDTNKLDGQNKRRAAIPLSSGHQKRSCSGSDGAASAQNGDQFSMANCVRVMNVMQGVDQRLDHGAMDLFQNPNWRETFMKLKSEKRLAWLLAMLPIVK